MENSTSYGLLLAGRFVLGFAVSLSAIAECIYISEIAPQEKRGMLVSLNELGITVGVLLVYLVNFTFADVDGGWLANAAHPKVPHDQEQGGRGREDAAPSQVRFWDDV